MYVHKFFLSLVDNFSSIFFTECCCVFSPQCLTECCWQMASENVQETHLKFRREVMWNHSNTIWGSWNRDLMRSLWNKPVLRIVLHQVITYEMSLNQIGGGIWIRNYPSRKGMLRWFWRKCDKYDSWQFAGHRFLSTRHNLILTPFCNRNGIFVYFLKFEQNLLQKTKRHGSWFK